MIKKLILNVSIVSLFSSSLMAEKINNNIQFVSQNQLYKVALNSFRNKNYKKSYELFNKLFEGEMDNILINFYLGRSAYELREYEFAISAYDRILIKDPRNTRTRLEMAQTYKQMKLYAQALKEFNIVLDDKQIPKSVRTIVEKQIINIKKLLKTDFYNSMFMAGVIYDSNIDGTSTTGAFDIYNPSSNSMVTVTNDDKEESTSIYQGMARVSHTKKFTDNYILTSSATAVVLKYDNHKEKDIHALSLSLSPSFLQKRTKIDIPITIDRVNQGHSSYQFNYSINPNITKIINNSLLYNLGFKYGKVNFFDDNTKNANIYELQNSFRLLTQDYGVFNFLINMGKESEQKDDRTDVDYKYINYTITNSFNFNKNYDLISSVNFKKSNYKDKDVNFLSKRKDKKVDYSIAIQKKLNKNMVFNIGTTRTKQNSNHVSSDYNKYSYKANLLWNFELD